MAEKTFNREVNNKLWSETMDVIQNKELVTKDKENMLTTTISYHEDLDLFVLEFIYQVRKNFGVKLNKKEALTILLMKGLNASVKEENEDGEDILSFYRRNNNLNFHNYISDTKATKRANKES